MDGFRFDLGSILTRAPSSWHLSNVGTTKGLTPQSPEGAIMPSAAGMPAGTPLAEPPLIQMIRCAGAQAAGLTCHPRPARPCA